MNAAKFVIRGTASAPKISFLGCGIRPMEKGIGRRSIQDRVKARSFLWRDTLQQFGQDRNERNAVIEALSERLVSRLFSQFRLGRDVIKLDLFRFIDPAIASRRPYDGQSSEILSFGWRDRTVEERLVRAVSRSYKGTQVRLHYQNLLAFYQNLSRPSGLTLACFLFSHWSNWLKQEAQSDLELRYSV